MLFLLIGLSQFLFAQQVEEIAVKAVVIKLFTAMQKGDTAAVRSCFDTTARLQTVLEVTGTGQTKLENTTVDKFISVVHSISKRGKHIEERIVQWSINIDKPLASVWGNYEFYVDGKLSHTGVDAFQLVNINNEWKIIQLCDTRKK